MKMKNLLLFFLALIVVVPAWGDTAAPVSWAGVVIELKGPAESVSALVAKLKEAPVYKAASCETASKLEATVTINCAKADNRLMAFLGKNAPATVQWSISSAAAGGKCTGNCILMPCPSATVCCNTTTHKPC